MESEWRWRIRDEVATPAKPCDEVLPGITPLRDVFSRRGFER